MRIWFGVILLAIGLAFLLVPTVYKSSPKQVELYTLNKSGPNNFMAPIYAALPEPRWYQHSPDRYVGWFCSVTGAAVIALNAMRKLVVAFKKLWATISTKKKRRKKK